MKVFINTFQTDSSYLHQMNDSEEYILATQELEATDNTFPVCLSLEDENGNVIASSGCYPEFPILTKQFVQDWFEGDFSEIEIIEAIDGILWEQDLGFMPITESNQLPEIPSEITTFTDKFGNVYDSLQACEEGELRHKHTNESEFTQNILIAQREKTAKRIELEKYYDLVQLEKEGRQNLRKHVLVKRKDMQPRVDFSLLPNAASVIFNAAKLLGEGIITIDSEEYQEAVKVANNLDFFMQCMKNPKFATLSSFELEKLLR